MIRNVSSKILLPAIMLLPLVGFAAVPNWQIQENKSKLTFTAVQNNSPVIGEFTKFTGDINFDPQQLTQSNVRIVVDTGSTQTSYKEIADTLKTMDWFHVKSFPKAIFEANSFTKTSDNTYRANGKLTLCDKTLPLDVTFVLDKYTPTEAHVTGEATIQRTKFGVGSGQWANTEAIKDDVKVNFDIEATKK